MKSMIRRVVMQSPQGLHLHPASEISKISSAYDAKISLCKANRTADARSIFEIIILGVSFGDKLDVSAVGRDAEGALEEICGYLDAYSKASLCDSSIHPCAA